MAREELPALLVTPIYEPTEAARLVGLSAGRVRRWLSGYQYRYTSGRTVLERRQKPVLRRAADSPHASFLDLIELWRARAFVEAGLSTQMVRRAFEEAGKITGLFHPFARKRFFLAGSKILLDIGPRQGKTPNLVELLSGGQQIGAPLGLFYLKYVEFDPISEAVTRWWPMGKDRPIIVDPGYSFGAPTVFEKGVKTAVVYQLYQGEQRNASRVAQWMQLEPAEVEAAVEFEQELRAA